MIETHSFMYIIIIIIIIIIHFIKISHKFYLNNLRIDLNQIFLELLT
ncbi:MAG: hypothetical protein N7Q72_01525 [Spiroplasma sp. Tabriz.8]|nr:hypothetical protein [Candidatus Regiella insecticola]MCZ8631924.1 hypothetical protein [Spiroplasma sp. Tabriz.8]